MMTSLYRSQHYRFAESVAFCALAGVMIVQNFVRPAANDVSREIQFMLGVAPNFLAGLGMCIGFFIHGFHRFTAWKIPMTPRVLLCVGLTILGLGIWEYIQVLAHRPFDANDVLASTIGSAPAALILFVSVRKNTRAGISDV